MRTRPLLTIATRDSPRPLTSILSACPPLRSEKVSLQAVEYYSKLPAVVTVDKLFILDPLIATGNTAIAAVNMILDWGLPISSISILAILGSAEGLKAVQSAFPELTVSPSFLPSLASLALAAARGADRRLAPPLQIYLAAVDHQLTSKGYISPGVGDTGDRIFGTSS